MLPPPGKEKASVQIAFSSSSFQTGVDPEGSSASQPSLFSPLQFDGGKDGAVSYFGVSVCGQCERGDPS